MKFRSKANIIGIDYDTRSLRMVKIIQKFTPNGARFKIQSLGEKCGDYSSTSNLIDDLARLKKSIGIRSSDFIVSCLPSKHTHILHLEYTGSPDKSSNQSILKTISARLPFDGEKSAFDYQFLNDGAQHNKTKVVCQACTSDNLNEHLEALKSANIFPGIVDSLPCASANAFLHLYGKAGKILESCLLLHIGADICTVTVDGPGPIYSRKLKFPAHDICSGNLPKEEKEIQFRFLIKEINKTIAYYDNRFHLKINTMGFLGRYLKNRELCEKLSKLIPLKIARIDLLNRYIDGVKAFPEKYALAIVLALRDRRTANEKCSPSAKDKRTRDWAPGDPMKYRVNLVRNLQLPKVATIQRRALSSLHIALLTLIALMSASIIGNVLYMYRLRQESAKQIQNSGSDSTEMSPLEPIWLKLPLKISDSLMSDKIHWTKIFTLLERHLPKNCRISQITADENQMRVKGAGDMPLSAGALDIIKIFISQLRTDPRYSVYFSQTSVSSIETIKKKDGEVISFEFVSRFN